MTVEAAGRKADTRRRLACVVTGLLLATPILAAGPQLASDWAWPHVQESYRILEVEAYSCHGVAGLFSVCRSSLRDGLADTVVVNEFHLGPAPTREASGVGMAEFAWPRRVTTSGALQRLPQRMLAFAAIVLALVALALQSVRIAGRRERPGAASGAPEVALAPLQKAA